MKELFIYKGLELEANINGYATYELKSGKFRTSYLGQLNTYRLRYIYQKATRKSLYRNNPLQGNESNFCGICRS